MSVQPGSGRPSLAPEMRRNQILRIAFREGQVLDIKSIADAWGVPTATAAWVMTSEFLSHCRKDVHRSPEINLALAASRRILREFEKTAVQRQDFDDP